MRSGQHSALRSPPAFSRKTKAVHSGVVGKKLSEVHRTHLNKLGWDKELANYFQSELRKSFPDAITNDFEHIVPKLTNHKKDRHVLAATIRAGSSLILTFNLKDFPSAALDEWGIQASHPQDYLIILYELDPPR